MRPSCRALFLCLFVWLLGVGALGCPTYENSYSGTFRETRVDPVTESQAVQVDFFRYGDNAAAILRYFQPDVVNSQPFGRESFCAWTRGDEFDEQEGVFQLPISSNVAGIPESTLRGEFSSEEDVTVTLHNSETGEPIVDTMEMVRVEEEPDPECDTPESFFINPDFDLGEAGPNRMPDGSDYSIENPVFAIQWVGVEETENGYQIATNDRGQRRELDNEFEADENTLRGDLKLELHAPPEKIRVGVPGETYALGHPVVIDDRSSSGGGPSSGFQTPIIATALQPGRRPDAPAEADGSGKAILFVEGDLRELPENVLEGSFSQVDAIRAGDLPERHFYVVDVDVAFRDSTVVEMTLPENSDEWFAVGNRNIPMRVTDRYLEENNRSLPRIWFR